jgi:hypothetical protein
MIKSRMPSGVGVIGSVLDRPGIAENDHESSNVAVRL